MEKHKVSSLWFNTINCLCFNNTMHSKHSLTPCTVRHHYLSKANVPSVWVRADESLASCSHTEIGYRRNEAESAPLMGLQSLWPARINHSWVGDFQRLQHLFELHRNGSLYSLCWRIPQQAWTCPCLYDLHSLCLLQFKHSDIILRLTDKISEHKSSSPQGG